MDYDFWDDRTLELYYSEGIHPCSGCSDFKDDECISNGACRRGEKEGGESDE